MNDRNLESPQKPGARPALEASEEAWRDFLERPPLQPDGGAAACHRGKTVLVAGAGGSIGSALALEAATADPRLLILLDRCEQHLHEIQAAIAAAAPPARTVAVLADVGDEGAMEELFVRYHPELVYHAAAYKHVPLVETNPLAGLRNNVVGTWVLAQAAARHGASALVALSTDKAANPRSVLGLSKRVAELAILALGRPGTETRMASLRLGNVLGSRGSVVPRFVEQIARGGPVTVTHPDARRYFLTIEESVRLIVRAAGATAGGALLAPELGRQIPVARLAEFLIRRAGLEPGRDIRVTFTGLRPGDKLSEDLLATSERQGAAVTEWLFRVETPWLEAGPLAEGIEALRRAAERWDAAAALEAARRLVPEYRPSAELVATLGLEAIDAAPPATLPGARGSVPLRPRRGGRAADHPLPEPGERA